MSDTAVSVLSVRLDPTHAAGETITPAVKPSQPTLSSANVITLERRDAYPQAQVIDIERLYQAVPGTSSQIVDALDLLKRVADFLAEARKSADPLEADRFVQRAQLALPKLFVYRSLGDGFGIIINSLHFAFQNLHGMPLTPDQINAMWRVLRELRTHPAMSLEQGIQRAEELEDRGLKIDPPDLERLIDDAAMA